MSSDINASDGGVQDALNEVLESPAAEEGSQSSSESAPETIADLTAKTQIDDISDDTSSKSAKDSSETGSKTVPYERLSQVVQQKNALADKYNALEEQYNNANARETELRDRVSGQEQDSEILEAIKNLALDDRYKDHVTAIDRALQGIDEEVQEATEAGDTERASKAELRLDEKLAEIEDLQDEQRADALWSETASRAKDMLEALPAEFTTEDKAVIGKLWTPGVDWDLIEEEGRDSIPQALNESFARTIKEYGTPRGALVANTTQEIESRIPEAKLTSSEDKIQSLLDTDWAETNDEGKAVQSDDDFAAGVAEMLRQTNSR